MSRTRGRPGRQYRLQVRTVRRDPIDYTALARAALEQSAMDRQGETKASPSDQHQSRRVRILNRQKDAPHDHLA